MFTTQVCSACGAAQPFDRFPSRNGRLTRVCRLCLASRARQRRAARRSQVAARWAASACQARTAARVQAATLEAIRRLGGPSGFACEIAAQLHAAAPGSARALRVIRALLQNLPGAQPGRI